MSYRVILPVATPVLEDQLAWRLGLQGDQPAVDCPEPGQVNGCFDVRD